MLADEHADPEYVAADLLSQAEHDEMAPAILVTPSRELAEAVPAGALAAAGCAAEESDRRGLRQQLRSDPPRG